MRKLAVLGSVLALLCWQTPLSVARIHPATNHEPFRDRFSVQDERKTAAAVQKQGHPEVRGRQLLASAVSQQNISYLLYGTFQQEFVYFANTTLSGYDLPPVAGKCSMDTTLDPAVANCASRNQLCCFDASYSQVRHNYGLTFQNGSCKLQLPKDWQRKTPYKWWLCT